MNVLNNSYRVLVLLILTGYTISGCHAGDINLTTSGERGDLRIMFYNVENLFDTWDDTLVNDNEFLPWSERKWSQSRYSAKLMNIFKVIAALGEETPPEIICLAEIENRKVLNDLIYETPLEKYQFGIVQYNSPDQRGIEVALLYRKDRISILDSKPIRIRYASSSEATTRDILYVQVLTTKKDTLNIFVNHWPSRRAGKKDSEEKRLNVANILRQKVDSLLNINANAKIIITGDFNDEPYDLSIIQKLMTQMPDDEIKTNTLYNLSQKKQQECKCGTYRYRAGWDMFDQFIVSGTILQSKQGLHTCPTCMGIADFDFLLKEDDKYGGMKPFPTYRGPVYQGGFSDHLPIYLDLYY